MTPVFFETDSIRMSMRNPETGKYLKASVYTLEGVVNDDGSLRELSIGQLVMAICLLRATDLEAKIVNRMTKMAADSDRLDVYADVEEDIAKWQSKNPTAEFKTSNLSSSEYPALYAIFKSSDGYNGMSRETFIKDMTIESKLAGTGDFTLTVDEVDELMTEIEKKMDSLNTVSQEDLIEIQSQTAKRDDTYSLASNVLKSLFTVMSGNVNNL